MSSCNTRTAISNVLFASDFSAESAQAVDCARRLSEEYGTNLYVVHVMDLFPYALGTDAVAAAKTEEIRRHSDAQMKRLLTVSRFDQNKIKPFLLAGEASIAIERFVSEREIDLIILGSRGDLGVSRLFEGSMAEEIFRTARCPVMVVGPKTRVRTQIDMFNRLLFSTDRSLSSRSALPYIEFLLHENPAAMLTLVHFLEEECPNVYDRHQLRRHLEMELVDMVAPIYRRQIEDIVVESSSPVEGMLKMADGSGADLLVLGVHSGGAFTRAATHGLCPITPRVISEIPCPVVTVRAV